MTDPGRPDLDRSSHWIGLSPNAELVEIEGSKSFLTFLKESYTLSKIYKSNSPFDCVMLIPGHWELRSKSSSGN